MVVTVQTESTFSAGNPELLTEGLYFNRNSARDYDIAPDGQRFLMLREDMETMATSDDPFACLGQINVVLNWFEELRQRVSVK